MDSALGVVGRFPFLSDSMLLMPELPHPDEIEERVRRQQWPAWHRALSGEAWCRFRRLGLPVRPALPVVVDHVRALLWGGGPELSEKSDP